MALKIHLRLNYNRVSRQGVTLCGEPFFRAVGRQYDDDMYAAVRRIGGIRVVEKEFEPTKHHCRKCAKAWADGKDMKHDDA